LSTGNSENEEEELAFSDNREGMDDLEEPRDGEVDGTPS
jgi:hypothetical protein